MSKEDVKGGTTQMSTYQAPPMVTDLLAPPPWSGPPGQLLPWSVTSQPTGVNYGIYGTDTQVLQVLLQPGESMQSEPGAMVYRASGIKMQTKAGGWQRCIGGESFFVSQF